MTPPTGGAGEAVLNDAAMRVVYLNACDGRAVWCALEWALRCDDPQAVAFRAAVVREVARDASTQRAFDIDPWIQMRSLDGRMVYVHPRDAFRALLPRAADAPTEVANDG